MNSSETVRLYSSAAPLKEMKKVTTRTLLLSLAIALQWFGNAQAQIRINAPQKISGGMRLTISGTSTTPVTLQASSDGRTWSDLQTYNTLTGSATFTDNSGIKARLYRARVGASTPTPTPLPDLAGFANSVFLPGEGIDTVQYAPNGTLGFLFWKDRNLVIRERTSSAWREQIIAAGGSGLQTTTERVYSSVQPAAVLLYDSSSNPHVFKVNGGTSIGHFIRVNNAWTQTETINANGAAGGIFSLAGRIGANNVFHLATLGVGGAPNIVYGSNKSGSWAWSVVANLGSDQGWHPGSYQRRHFAMAVDSRNAAHIVYRPAITYTTHPQGYKRAYSKLNYASNSTGTWRTELVTQPTDESGESACGASIAIGPNDAPAIVNWFNDRGDGGSASWSRLHYFTRNTSGQWGFTIVTSRPDGYIAGDGEKGTGAIPYLRFDPQGRPHILFLDHASEHFPFQNEYIGNVRHAWWTGTQWQAETLLRQSVPLAGQVVYTGFAVTGNELAVTALQRLTVWNTAINPQTSVNTYKLSVLTKSL